MKKVIKYAAINSFGAAAYIVGVVSLMNFLTRFSDAQEPILIPISMLMLLVFSVAIMGTLIFGRPILWYIDGKKKEAVSLLAYTLGIFFVIILISFIFLIIVISGNVNMLPLADN